MFIGLLKISLFFATVAIVALFGPRFFFFKEYQTYKIESETAGKRYSWYDFSMIAKDPVQATRKYKSMSISSYIAFLVVSIVAIFFMLWLLSWIMDVFGI